MRQGVLLVVVNMLGLWLSAHALASGPGCPSWLPTFGGSPGTDGSVLALAVHDDGSGGGRRCTRVASS
jgi:hypothetical protein